MKIETQKLRLFIKNRKTDNVPIKDFSGIGIENTRKRLELLYGNNYSLDINDEKNYFIVNLSIPI
jgi:two-component system LytT family sensor kinase